jgi:hypothetical protein
LSEIINSITSFSLSTTAGGRSWILEFTQLWSEVAGMIMGQVVILAILLLVRQMSLEEETE